MDLYRLRYSLSCWPVFGDQIKPEGVNMDGTVNILDLTLVAQGFGTDNKAVDVNGDGALNSSIWSL